MGELWDVAFVLAIVVVALLLPRVSPCCGCAVADGVDAVDTLTCRKECQAFLAYQSKTGRL
jgi:hypothetical protein